MIKTEVAILNVDKGLPFPKLMIDNEGTIIYAEMINKDEPNLIIGHVLRISGNQLLSGRRIEGCIASRFTDFYGSITLTQTPE